MKKILNKIEGVDYGVLIKKWENAGFMGNSINPTNLALAYELARHYLNDKNSGGDLEVTMFPILHKVIGEFKYDMEEEDILFIINHIYFMWDNEKYVKSVNIEHNEVNFMNEFCHMINNTFLHWNYLAHGYGEDIDWNQTIVTKFNIAVESIEKEAHIIAPIVFKDLFETLLLYNDGKIGNRFTVNYENTSKSKMMKIGDKFLIIEQY